MSVNTLSNKRRPARVLLVEDNHGDAILMRRAFEQAKIVTQLSVASTGEEALLILRKKDSLEAPDLILLDLNMPKMNGHEILWEIKNDIALKHIPVIVLSSSSAEQDVIESYALHANGYIVKPVGLDNCSEIIHKLEQFWFDIVVLPDSEDAIQASLL